MSAERKKLFEQRAADCDLTAKYWQRAVYREDVQDFMLNVCDHRAEELRAEAAWWRKLAELEGEP